MGCKLSFLPQPSSREVAFHEAGHIVAGIKAGKTFISAEMKPGKLTGRASTSWASGSSSTFAEGFTAAAGPVAEAMLNSSAPLTQFPPGLYGVNNDESVAAAAAQEQILQDCNGRTVSEIIQEYLSYATVFFEIEQNWCSVQLIAEYMIENEFIDNAQAQAIIQKCASNS